MGEVLEFILKRLAVVPPRLAVHAGRGLSLQAEIGRAQRCWRIDVVKERGEPHLLALFAAGVSAPAHWRATPALSPGRVLLKQISLVNLFPPSPPQPVAQPCSRTSQVLQVCPTSACVHHRRVSIDFPMRPIASSVWENAGPPGSRARCFGTCAGSVTTRDSHTPRNIGAHVLPSATPYGVGVRRLFFAAGYRPAPSLSTLQAASRAAPHDSEPVWFAKPSLYETFIHYTSPVFFFYRRTRRTICPCK